MVTMARGQASGNAAQGDQKETKGEKMRGYWNSLYQKPKTKINTQTPATTKNQPQNSTPTPQVVSYLPEAPADIIPEFTAIFKIITSTAAAWPPSATVATVMPAITSSVAKTTSTINNTDSSCVSKHLRQRNVAASLYDPLMHAAHCVEKKKEIGKYLHAQPCQKMFDPGKNRQ